MGTPKRRSSRLRGSNTSQRKSMVYANRLDSLTERDETPSKQAQSNLDSVASSPHVPRTPATAGKVTAPLEEMHPSKAHHSTMPEPDSGLRLGFTDIKAQGNGHLASVLQTPSKTGISDKSSFEFRYARAAPQLGPEAQRMMDDLREEALRIKAKLAAEHDQAERSAGEAHAAIAGRKIAQPKGKVGRFSDAHMSQFKKMDSIAGHPSSFRAQQGRFTPTENRLKRSPSKAQLDDTPGQHHKREYNSTTTEQLQSENPVKRARNRATDDTSSARPVSRGESYLPATPTMARSQSNLATITTPTQASLARSASRKTATMIPNLRRATSTSNLSPPKGLTRSATGILPRSASKHALQSPSKFDRFRSLMAQPSAAESASVSSAIPKLSRSQSRPHLNKALPSTPGGAPSVKAVKHVSFTPDAVDRRLFEADAIPNSPSPIKSGIPRATSKINLNLKSPVKQPVIAKSHPDEVAYPTLAGLSGSSVQSPVVEYPSLAGVRSLTKAPRQATLQAPPPSAPGTFTFRSDSTIKFGASPETFGSSPGQSSLRQVRPSIPPNTMRGTFSGSNKENTRSIPSIPHGMSNKKRRRTEPDEEEEEDDRSPKKHKGVVAEGHMLLAPKLQVENVNERKIATPAKKRGVLSLSRLNMLARPKNRK